LGSATVAALVGYWVPADPLAATLIPLLLGWLFGITLAGHILIGWIPRWRKHFWRVLLALALPLVILASFTLSFEYIWNERDAAAHAYVSTVRPMLDNFHRVYGRYPSGMWEIPSAPRQPSGLMYGIEPDGNSYNFAFQGDYYSSFTGEWVNDD
jgi:hypothetical protein